VGDTDLPVAGFEVNLGEHGCALESVKKSFNTWDGVPILDCLFVEGAKVDTEAECAPVLANKEDRRAIRRFRRFDEATSKKISELNIAFV
jgi:hypothetical protein